MGVSVGSRDELDALRVKYNVLWCVNAANAALHRVDKWSRSGGHGGVLRGVHSSDGLSRPTWDFDLHLVAVGCLSPTLPGCWAPHIELEPPPNCHPDRRLVRT